MSKFAGVKKGDVVRLKFLPLNELVKVKDKSASHSIINHWNLGSNVLAYVYGGDFLVREDVKITVSQGNILELSNHLDGEDFDVPEDLVESITIVDVTTKFISEKHNLVIVNSNDAIYINGEALTNTDDDMLLDKFLSFAEQIIINKAVENSLKDCKND